MKYNVTIISILKNTTIVTVHVLVSIEKKIRYQVLLSKM